MIATIAAAMSSHKLNEERKMDKAQENSKTPDLLGEAEKKESMIAAPKTPPSQQPGLLDPNLKKAAVEGMAEPAVPVKPGKLKLEMHEIENGYVIIQDGRAFGIKKDDFLQVQRLMKGEDVVQYNRMLTEEIPWKQQRNVNIQELASVAMASEGIVVIHKLTNCYMIVGPQGAYLARTEIDGLAAVGQIFKTL